ncbi:MAG: amino acid adenylation domain-containing protein, partial [Aquabacterium sp.]|uniref:amino acid adenylation domain-containing protein n=1 Tax=Aquabacterium sp. TaxID=1872578 RepID=UPI002724484D
LGGSPAYEAPQGELETALAALWAEVLGVPRVGRRDNFFELGGHSLLAIQLLERLRRSGWTVTVRTLFQHAVFADFAAQVAGEGMGEKDAAPLAVPPNLIPLACEAIRPEMLTLVALNQAHIDSIEAAVPGGAQNIQDIYPLAPLQQGIFFHHLLQTEGDVYVNALLLSFHTPELLHRFIDGLNQVIARHDILRTAFHWEGLPEPVQVVHRHARLDIDWFDKDGDEDRIAERLTAHVDSSRYRLDVRRAPLLRAIAAHDPGQDRWLLQLPHHHLTLDHTSDEILIEEISLILQGRQADLPEPVPFRRFVAQSRLGLSEQQHESFFRGMLGDVKEPTLPFGLNDVQGDGKLVEEIRLPLDASLSRQLREKAQRHGVSAATLFHLAWALVLSKVSGQDDVVFGTVLFGRMQSGAEADRALGLFINTLPIRIKLGARAVDACLKQTQSALVGLLAHEHASLTLAQRCSGMPAGSSLFSALLNYRHIGHEDRSGEAGQAWAGMDRLDFKERTNYPFTMSVDDLGAGFDLVAQVSDGVGAQRLCGYMQATLQWLIQSLGQGRLASELDVLTEQEHGALRQRGTNDLRYLNALPVHQLIEAQAERRADSTALVFGEEQLSHGELNARANRLAHRLVKLGVRPEVKVGIVLERSIEMVVGLLAILKAGGAYVPLDPQYPVDRLSYMVDDSGVALLLTQGEIDIGVAGGQPLAILSMDGLDLQDEPDHNPGVALRPDSLAYLIYTSGSTGRPKGVMLSHQGLSHFLLSMQAAPGMTEADTLVAVTSLSFDIAALELYLPLMVGARIVLAPREVTRDAEALARLVHESQTTVLQSTPAGWRLLREGGWPPAPLSGFKGLCGGEALQPDLAEDLAALGVELWNMYGPTETTIWSSSDRVEGGVPDLAAPIAGTRFHVLDAGLQAVPNEVPGELYIGGVGLARGYARRPGLTAERFVADPFDDTGAGRLYRTGDLVRWRTDGRLEYLGRLDHQVKVRGHRIELGEIEARLLAQPEVGDALVVARQEPSGVRLVAYVSPHAGQAIDTAALRDRLGLALPDYMVPAAIAVLERLPLNANGKIDRRALPDPGVVVERAHELPQGEVEAMLASIWAEVLGLERVGRHDNFFELGGHSLTALRVLTRVRASGDARLKFELPDLMRSPTIASLAERGQGQKSLTPLNGLAGDRPLYCIHPGMGTVMEYLPLARSLKAVRPVQGLACRTLFDLNHQDRSMSQMADDYVAMLRAAQPQGPYALLGWSLGGALAAMVAARLEAQGQAVAFLGLVDTHVPGIGLSEAGDWSEAFNASLQLVLPGLAHAHRLPEETGDLRLDEAAVVAKLKEILLALGDAVDAPYSGVGAEEIARIFMAGQAIARAVLGPVTECLPERLATEVHCWWSASRPDEEVAELVRQMPACQLTQRHIDADHFGIIHHALLLEEVTQAMALR